MKTILFVMFVTVVMTAAIVAVKEFIRRSSYQKKTTAVQVTPTETKQPFRFYRDSVEGKKAIETAYLQFDEALSFLEGISNALLIPDIRTRELCIESRKLFDTVNDLRFSRSEPFRAAAIIADDASYLRASDDFSVRGKRLEKLNIQSQQRMVKYKAIRDVAVNMIIDSYIYDLEKQFI